MSNISGITIGIRDGGYVPKSGLFLAQILDCFSARETVLDIGTGETGFLAYHLLTRGHKRIIACDINEQSIKLARVASQRSSDIVWKISDVYSNVSNFGFDLIVSNPPQMPMATPGDIHDYGGLDGRDVISRIMNGSSKFLSVHGRLLILCFDFLGVEKRYNTSSSLLEIAGKLGFQSAIIGRRERQVRLGGKTEENLGWINQVYPSYRFKKSPGGNYCHDMLIMEMWK